FQFFWPLGLFSGSTTNSKTHQSRFWKHKPVLLIQCVRSNSAGNAAAAAGGMLSRGRSYGGVAIRTSSGACRRQNAYESSEQGRVRLPVFAERLHTKGLL